MKHAFVDTNSIASIEDYLKHPDDYVDEDGLITLATGVVDLGAMFTPVEDVQQ